MKIKDIIKKYKNGELNDCLDEQGAGGWWDFAGDLIRRHIDYDKMPIIDELQDEIYTALKETVKRTQVKRDTLKKCIKLSDTIELEYRNTEFNEWRMFKGFSDAMRDKLT